jgi:hypothetical protein
MLNTKFGTLTIKDSQGFDYTNDFIGNHDGLKDFLYNEDTGLYECKEVDFNFWDCVIIEAKKLYRFKDEINEINDSMETIIQDFFMFEHGYEATNYGALLEDLKTHLKAVFEDGEQLKKLGVSQLDAEEIHALCK